MQKTVTLTPKYITGDSSFTGVLNGGEDYRTFRNDGVEVGTIAFDTSPIGRLSTACVLDYYSVSFEQKCNRASIPEMWWTLTPKKISTYTVSGSTINIISSSNFGSAAESRTNGTNYLSKTCSFGVGSNQSGIFSGALLGFYLSGDTDRTANSKLYMNGLSASVTYTARYKAKFYDDDGTLLDTQTLDAGVSPTAPTLSREGYYVRWEKDGVEYAKLPSSTDTDIAFTAVYERIPRAVFLARPSKGGLTLELSSGGSWVRHTPSESTTDGDYYTLWHGDAFRVVANECNTVAEDLVVTVRDLSQAVISSETVDGSASTHINVYSGTATQNILVYVTPQTVNIPIVTSATGAGTITQSHVAVRHSNDVVTITPSYGYYLSVVTVNYEPIEVEDGTGMSIELTDITSEQRVEAVFLPVQHAITFNLPSGVTVTGASAVAHGNSATWTFECNSDKSLTRVTLDGFDLISGVFKQVALYECTLDNVMESHAFTVEAEDVVTVEIEQTEGGTVVCADMDGASGYYVPGNGSLTFTAEPDEGWRVSVWHDGNTQQKRTIQITNDLTVSAAFVHPTAAVKVVIEGNGTVEKSKDYAYDDEDVTFTAIPAEGHTLGQFRWQDGGTSQQSEDNPLTVRFGSLGAHKITAEFFPALYQFVVTSSEDSCSVFVADKQTPDVPYTYTDAFFDSKFIIRAIPVEGWHFVRWSDNNKSAEREFAIPAHDVALQAIFKKDTFTVEVETGDGGTATESKSVEYGDDFLVEITADYCYKIKDVMLDGASAYDKVTLTRRGGKLLLQNVIAQHKVEVIFEPRIYQGHRLLDYYPPVIASIREIELLMDNLQVTDNALWDSMSFVMENQYIDSATVEGVTMWERELGIIPAPTDTLTERKARLRLKWVPNNRFTMKWLHEWLETVCGTSIQTPTVSNYVLTVVLPWFVQWVDVFKDLEQYKPANIILQKTVSLPAKDIVLLTGFALKTDMKYTVSGSSPE